MATRTKGHPQEHNATLSSSNGAREEAGNRGLLQKKVHVEGDEVGLFATVLRPNNFSTLP